jgi:3-ketosteroid 9alpha-monooxygenase subunit B
VSDHVPAPHGHGYHPLAVKALVQESPDAYSLVFEVPDELEETFGYSPGQFCTFRLQIDDVEQLRSYSMSSTPGIDRSLTVTVKRVEGGVVSNWLLDNLKVGDIIEATKPAGVFCPQLTSRRLLAFCGGSGITPVMSIAKHVLALTGRTMGLLYANRDAGSVIFENALTELKARHSERLQVSHHLDAEMGLVTSTEILDFVANETEADFYICGPGLFMDLVERTLHNLGVPEDHIFIERFLIQPDEKDLAAIDATSDAVDIPDEVTVILAGKKTVVRYQPGDTLLETARRGSLRPPFSCEAGNCATCMAFLKEGTVTMRANNALTPEEVEEGWVLTCQSLPHGSNVTVEYEAL